MPEKHDHPAGPKHGQSHLGELYYSELNRVIAILFAGILALMTFLLTVGVQRPHQGFSWALYSAIIVLSLNLIAFMAGHMFHGEYVAAAVAADGGAEVKDDDEDGKKALDAKRVAALKRLKMVRLVQQALFIVGVACVAWFAISAAHFFFSIPAAPTGPTPQ